MGGGQKTHWDRGSVVVTNGRTQTTYVIPEGAGWEDWIKDDVYYLKVNVRRGEQRVVYAKWGEKTRRPGDKIPNLCGSWKIVMQDGAVQTTYLMPSGACW